MRTPEEILIEFNENWDKIINNHLEEQRLQQRRKELMEEYERCFE